ncbi:MAG: hypothetical protein AABY06_00250 [Nanoarchaeota archaeon]
MKIEGDKISEIEIQLNNLEHEIKNFEHSFILKDLKKFNESNNKINLIQKKIKILTT